MTVPTSLSNPGYERDATGGDAYARAGVNLGARNDLVQRIKRVAGQATRPEVMAGVGPFGALFRLGSYREPVLVSSTDGVGTKLRIAMLMGRYDTVGQDLVNHCVNDILTSGAHPLFFLDYVGSSDLADERKLELIGGMAQACAAHGCALIGGETADMPDIYAPGDFDLVGFIVGVVEREHVIDGSAIAEGDVLLALPSTGLHTNGYSLVRRVFGVGTGGDEAADRAALERDYTELEGSLGDALLAVHRSYYDDLKPVLTRLHGIAHITGGGIIDNVPRILPDGLAARFDVGAWRVPALFSLIQDRGAVTDTDMYHTFNMGLGMVLAVAPEDAEAIGEQVRDAKAVGRVVRQADERRVLIG
ncbi:MAG TPA: phosphoribosylformylglycinamidine cyclo-ligase [Dehalococcoidia bacterium]|nr:phosphoribosylformylglycinamidine cyclo-ligase [Dehalococcoidia bacterium]